MNLSGALKGAISNSQRPVGTSERERPEISGLLPHDVRLLFAYERRTRFYNPHAGSRPDMLLLQETARPGALVRR
jgi:hypothetical protein